ncbi:B-cell antigen receptor complex-associated protein alpha chain isoform X1 [Dicentrarchus labrax]|uniref:B-cell antigen receptor complex-associated protein alpha chain isoform X1 n=1 Tax=Dicentrarchus labrax TaxID=13489 RepID=UPI0021F5A9A6|nr:B-cell antigen receptor complex-associated protein alpha chain isoform X1 [Dicentrarchus labrax]
MGTLTNVLLCSFVVVFAQNGVKLEADKPFERQELGASVSVQCCYVNVNEKVPSTWVKLFVVEGKLIPQPVENSTALTTKLKEVGNKKVCYVLTFETLQLNDSGMYQCWLKSKGMFTHGTYLQVYKPVKKAINLSENTKNKILTAEGILLLLCVLLPSVTLLRQSKRLNELERKKSKKEEENIYQGLNLDDCCTTYDQIERSQGHGPYQDVCNIAEEEEEIQLEKP